MNAFLDLTGCIKTMCEYSAKMPLLQQWLPVLWHENSEKISHIQDMTDALPGHICLPVCLWIMDPHSRAPKKNTSHGKELLPQDTTHLIQSPCYQRGSPCQDPAGNWTTRRPDHRKETQTAVAWSCFPFIRSGQNHLARHSERGKKTRLTEEEVGRQHQGMDRPGVRQVPESGGEQGKMEKTDCKIICGAPTTLAIKGLMMMTPVTSRMTTQRVAVFERKGYLRYSGSVCDRSVLALSGPQSCQSPPVWHVQRGAGWEERALCSKRTSVTSRSLDRRGTSTRQTD